MKTINQIILLSATLFLVPFSGNASELTHYSGSIDDTRAEFTLLWNDDSTVAGEISRAGFHNWRVDGTNNEEGVLMATMSCLGYRMGTARLEKSLDDTLVIWTGMLTERDGSKIPMVMKRPRANQAPAEQEAPVEYVEQGGAERQQEVDEDRSRDRAEREEQMRISAEKATRLREQVVQNLQDSVARTAAQSAAQRQRQAEDLQRAIENGRRQQEERQRRIEQAQAEQLRIMQQHEIQRQQLIQSARRILR